MKHAQTKITNFFNNINSDLKEINEQAQIFIHHYEMIISEAGNENSKAILLFYSKQIAFDFHNSIIDQLNSPSRVEKSSAPFPTANYSDSFTTSFGFPEEWHTGKLPHRNKSGLVQFLTFRLADSLPQEVLKRIEADLKESSGQEREVWKRKKYQKFLDSGYGCCALSHPEMARVLFDALKHHDGIRYDLLAWSIMPNHVHVLIKTHSDVSKILQSWKSFTGRWALANNKKFGFGIPEEAEQFWMAETWDRFIRDEEHFNNTINYTLNNPGKARLPVGSVAYEFTGSRLNRKEVDRLRSEDLKLVLNPEDLKLELSPEDLKLELQMAREKVLITHGLNNFDQLEIQSPIFVFRYESIKI